jgi:flagellar assembly protein FliH
MTGYPANGEEVRVIDYNELISEKLEKIRIELEKNSEEFNEDGFTVGLSAVNVSELLKEHPEEAVTEENVEEKKTNILQDAHEEAEKLVQKAENDAAAILNKAEQERLEILQSSSKEGFDKGYQEGLEKCQSEFEEKKAAFEVEMQQQKQELKKQKEEMEPQLVDTILDVFSNMTHLLAKDKRDLILTIVNSALEDMDVGKNYIIHACHEDAVFLKENREKIAGEATDADIDIIEDVSMKRGQCIIDTDVGVIDCSLDIQLEELMEDIRLLSCVGRSS